VTAPEQIQIFITRWLVHAWGVALAGILLVVVFRFELSGRQRAGLSGVGRVVPGTPDDPLRDPDSQRIIFASTDQHPGTSEFELCAVNRDGSKLEPITLTGSFNAFPQFSPDGKRLVFTSNRNAKQPHEINIFLADWED
jgi:hypothetical protein